MRNYKLLAPLITFLLAMLTPLTSVAGLSSDSATELDLTATWFGIAAIVTFVVAYGFVINEEFLHLRKSKPVIVSAGIIWILVGIAYTLEGQSQAASDAIRENFLEYAELFLFLLAAMTYINTMEERNIFRAIRVWLVSSGYSLRTIFWVTGVMAFFISPIADNLTTALLMAAVIMAVGAGNNRFIAIASINIVVAANAGGAFSPFGDITTLMVWQKGIVRFEEFFVLFTPSVVNWLIPAAILVFAVPKAKPEAIDETADIKTGGFVVVGLFLVTITLTVLVHNFLNLPPFLGMMTGLGLLKLYGFYIRRDELRTHSFSVEPQIEVWVDRNLVKPSRKPFDIFISMKRVEWDTLMFFYGVILSVGGLGTIGYLAHVSQFFYVDLGPTWANIFVGIASAIVDNIPVMYAVLTMNPDMSLGQWLLVTLTAGVGGSLLSIGSAAGIALMGQARGIYTFFFHLKWTWAIALGYAASIWVHFLVNAKLM
ncbi:MAG: sodium:proton antiporter NhaD [Acidiferrobacterales bacterium]